MLRRCLYFLAFVGLLWGCGTVNSVDPNLAAQEIASNPITYKGFVLGRVMLEHPRDQVSVEFQTLSGLTFMTTTTEKTGFFWVRNGFLPDDFRVVATPPDQPLSYVLEIRGGWRGGTLYVNAISTLASRYSKKHPEFSYVQAEQRIRSSLGLKDDYPISWVSLLGNPTLDMVKFWNISRSRGGVETYLQELIARIDAEPSVRIRELETDHIHISISGLGEEEALTATETVAKKTGETVVNDTLSVAFRGIVGRTTSVLGFNIGTAGEVSEAIALLDEVLAELSTLGRALSGDQLQSQLDSYTTAMNATLVEIQLKTDTIKTDLKAWQSTNTNTATVPPAGPVNNTLLATSNGYVLTIFDNLFSSGSQPGILQDYTQLQMNSLNFANPTTSYAGYPLRTNKNTQKQQNNLGFYLNWVVQGMNLIAETAGVVTPAGGLPTAASIQAAAHTYLNTAALNIQSARLQVPDLLPNNQYPLLVNSAAGQYDLVCDLDQYAMFYGYFFPQMDMADAQWAADQFSIGPYDDWGFASKDTFTGLTQDRIKGLVADDDDFADWENAFISFGFDTTHYGEYANSEPGGFQITGDLCQSWMISYDTGYGPQNVYQWQGTFSNPSTATYDSPSTYILYRRYPGTASNGPETGKTVVSPNTFMFMSGNPIVTAASNASQNPVHLQAQMKFNGNGYSTNNGQPLDVTNYCVWQSSDEKTASVSAGLGSDSNNPNAPPGPIGTVFWHPNPDGTPLRPVTLSATYRGLQTVQTVANVTGSLTLNPPAGLKAQLVSLQITPINYQLPLITQSSATQLYYAVAYYADGQLYDVSTNANTVWKLLDSNGNQINSQAAGGGFLSTKPNELVLYNTLTTTNLSVNVTYTDPGGNSISGSAPVSADLVTP